ncbi:MAG: hypothetical protein MK312_04205, partial [Roseibacillus sp.]|nr:hypothetical protein [Roseibacillus sp.]
MKCFALINTAFCKYCGSRPHFLDVVKLSFGSFLFRWKPLHDWMVCSEIGHLNGGVPTMTRRCHSKHCRP